MYLKKYAQLIFIAGTILIYVIKFIVRPYVPVSHIMQPLVDVMPNLVGSFLLPFGACLFLGKYMKLQNLWELRLVCISGLGLVITNEYLQLITFFGRTFDYLDIISSFAGVSAGYFAFAKMMEKATAREV